jgi:integrase
MTFVAAYEQWVRWKAPTWRQSTAKAATNPFKNGLVSIGKRPVADVGKKDIIAVLETVPPGPMRDALRSRLLRCMDFAVSHGWREPGLNPATWRGNLDVYFPTYKHETKHHRTMPYERLPGLMEQLRANTSVAARALEVLILTASRNREVRLATWNQIDFDRQIWTRPASLMKSKREHRVSIVGRPIEIFRFLHANRTGDLVFPGVRGGEMDSAWWRPLLPDGVTVHGMRTSFRIWVMEQTSFPSEAAEIQLDHVLGNAVTRAYARSDLFDIRREMMTTWRHFLQISRREI